MGDILRRIADGRILVTGSLWVKGDTGRWHECRPLLAGWTVDATGAASYPEGAIDLSGESIGSSFYIKSADDGLYHQFVMTVNDPSDPGFTWADYAQSSSLPGVHITLANARCEDGLYLVDVEGSQLHKMSVVAGVWTEEAQGYTIPL